MQEKHHGHCVLPKESDIRWMGYGGMPSDVSKPTIFFSSTFFELEIKCESETIRISGTDSSSTILMPGGSFLEGSDTGIQMVIETVVVQK